MQAFLVFPATLWRTKDELKGVLLVHPLRVGVHGRKKTANPSAMTGNRPGVEKAPRRILTPIPFQSWGCRAPGLPRSRRWGVFLHVFSAARESYKQVSPAGCLWFPEWRPIRPPQVKGRRRAGGEGAPRRFPPFPWSGFDSPNSRLGGYIGFGNTAPLRASDGQTKPSHPLSPSPF